LTDVEDAEHLHTPIFYHPSGRQEILTRRVPPEYLIALQASATAQDDQMRPSKHLRHIFIVVPVPIGRVRELDFLVAEAPAAP
jgi:hypothetical protein